MFLIVGLGNPGSQYAGTRHNVGFEVLDCLAEKYKTSFTAGRGEFLNAVISEENEDILLVKPLTYMNNSGVAVVEVLEQVEVDPKRMLIVFDDFQLQLGQLRIRLAGTDGGHNGIASVIYHLQSDEVPRLRCGIGSQSMPTTREGKINFVLSNFSLDEKPGVRIMIQMASDACILAAKESIDKAMNRYNAMSL